MTPVMKNGPAIMLPIWVIAIVTMPLLGLGVFLAMYVLLPLGVVLAAMSMYSVLRFDMPQKYKTANLVGAFVTIAGGVGAMVATFVMTMDGGDPLEGMIVFGAVSASLFAVGQITWLTSGLAYKADVEQLHELEFD